MQIFHYFKEHLPLGHYISCVEFLRNSVVVGVRSEYGARSEAVSWSTHGRRGEISRKIRCVPESECKVTLMKWGFPNFLAKKCKKLVFCNVEMTKRRILGSKSSVCSPSCLKLWEGSKV